jgi:hypothetical protein
MRRPSACAIFCTIAAFPHPALPFAGILAADSSISNAHSTIGEKASLATDSNTVRAARLAGRLDAEGFPADADWEKAPAVRFDQDWQGKNSDSKRETEVRVLWNPDSLYFRFAARYRTLTVFDHGDPDGRTDSLWERDVAEVFLQPNEFSGRYYKEIEVSPNGLWIDLDIAPAEKHDLKSGLKRRVMIDRERMVWDAQLTLPMKSLTSQFDPKRTWRVNFYRVEGAEEPRFYSAWRPTGTPVANFHVPESFGKLVFEP